MPDENLNGRATELVDSADQADGGPAPKRSRPRAKKGASVDTPPAAPKPAPKRRATKTPAAKAEPAPAKPARTRSRARAVAQEAPAAPLVAPQAEPIEIAVAQRPSEPEEQEIAVRMSGSGAQQLAEELYEVEVEVRNANQADSPNSLASDVAANLLRLVAENLGRLAEPQVQAVRGLLDRLSLSDYLDPDFWQGIGMVLRYQIDEQVAFIQRRARGEYVLDRYGLDREIVEIVRPFQSFMYRSWWRTTTEGAGLLPTNGRALMMANQSGILPWDATQISTAVAEERSDLAERVVRPLYINELNNLPFVGQLLSALGQVPALAENAAQLLADDELVCVFPEGSRGAGKLFRDRYRLAHFGRGGFVAAALRTGAPIVPVAVIGAEETYPMLANIEPLARALRLPYFPITPLFPWLGPLGLLPLPTRWKITFCEPVMTDRYGPEAADDPLTVFMLSEQIRGTIQEVVDEQLVGRGGVF
jgi:1-acyl-sn-glycerol-3-phosphate acyltransferase